MFRNILVTWITILYSRCVIVEVMDHNGMWVARITWYSASIKRRIFHHILERSHRNHGFRPPWLYLIPEGLATWTKIFSIIFLLYYDQLRFHFSNDKYFWWLPQRYIQIRTRKACFLIRLRYIFTCPAINPYSEWSNGQCVNILTTMILVPSKASTFFITWYTQRKLLCAKILKKHLIDPSWLIYRLIDIKRLRQTDTYLSFPIFALTP